MIYIGIDVAKDKHDCFITNSDSDVLFKAFTIANNLDGEYSCAVTPQIRQMGNHLSGNAGTAYASLLA